MGRGQEVGEDRKPEVVLLVWITKEASGRYRTIGSFAITFLPPETLVQQGGVASVDWEMSSHAKAKSRPLKSVQQLAMCKAITEYTDEGTSEDWQICQ